MKTFKLIILSIFFLILGNQTSMAQQASTNKPEQYLPNQVKVKSEVKKNTKTKKIPANSVKISETSKLFSKQEIEARALTAKKSKESGKGKISPEAAKKMREARIAAIIEANKTKKKKQSKRSSKTETN